MGGEGSGRKPDVMKMAREQFQNNVVEFQEVPLVLPNYSGVKTEALKTSSTDITSNWTTSGSDIYNANTGNVGIGTTSPTFQGAGNYGLHINNAASATNEIHLTNGATGTTGTDGFILQLGSTGIGYLWNMENSNLSFGTNASARMTIDNSGSVGIGTTAPSSLLHISGGASGATAQTYTPLVVEDDTNCGVSVLSANTSVGVVLFGDAQDNDIGRIRYDHNTDDMQLWTSGSARLTILSGGSVGIGTTSPGAPLTVQSDAVYNGEVGALRLQTATDNNMRLYLGYDKNLNAGYVQAQQAGTNWEPLLLNPNGGSVGIGTTSPAPAIWGGPALQINGSAPELRLTDNTVGATGDFSLATNAGKFYIYDSSVGTRLSIDASGSVGIGTTSPTSQLTLSGGAVIEMTNAADNTPTIALSGGIFLSGGALWYKGFAGTYTQLAAA